MNLKRTIHYYFIRLKRLQGSPRSLAMGSAVGAAIGITPTLPFHTVLILAATILLRVNPIAGIISATIVSNPLTFVPHYYAAWWIGDHILPGRLTWHQISELLYLLNHEGFVDGFKTLCEVGYNTLLVMMVGGMVLALPTGIITYFIAFRFFVAIHKKRRQKHLLNNHIK